MNSHTPVNAESTHEPATVEIPPRRSWLARALLDTLGRTGARLGLACIATIAFFAVFAPILANSHPIFIVMDGRISSPMVKHFTATDVTLLFGALVALVLQVGPRFPRFKIPHLSRRQKMVIWTSLTIPICLLSVWLVNPPKAVVYEQYREAQAEGRAKLVLRTLIPFSPSDRLRDQFNPDLSHPWPPSFRHPLGTERHGADILSRMIHASRIALAVGFIAEGLALIIGVTIGCLMGFFAGFVDLIGMRLVEIFSTIPRIYLLLTFVAFFGRNLYLIMAIIGLTSWVRYALFTRAEFLSLRKQDFVQAATACGLPLRSILFRHMLPNAMAPILVSVSFGVASAILAESTLSFLGLGLIDEPSWGQLLNQALSAGGGFYWWLATFPGLAIFLTVFSYNLIGESLRDAIDPHLQRAAV